MTMTVKKNISNIEAISISQNCCSKSLNCLENANYSNDWTERLVGIKKKPNVLHLNLHFEKHNGKNQILKFLQFLAFPKVFSEVECGGGFFRKFFWHNFFLT